MPAPTSRTRRAALKGKAGRSDSAIGRITGDQCRAYAADFAEYSADRICEAFIGHLTIGLIWNDLSNQLVVRTNSKAAAKAVEAAIATVDHSDIRGSEPHNRDPSGATSD